MTEKVIKDLTLEEMKSIHDANTCKTCKLNIDDSKSCFYTILEKLSGVVDSIEELYNLSDMGIDVEE